jgi:hypothetical protein
MNNFEDGPEDRNSESPEEEQHALSEGLVLPLTMNHQLMNHQLPTWKYTTTRM